MPIYSAADVPDRLRDTEIVVVGAGAVGIAMAVRMARAGRRVVLLEAGPAEPSGDYRSRNGGLVTGRTHSGICEGRMKALGGTTHLWGGQLTPFNRRDLEAADAQGRRLWPIGYGHYAQAVEAAYQMLGVGAAARDTAGVWRQSVGRETQLADDLRLHLNLWLPVPQFDKLFAADLAWLATLSVITDASVEGLDFAADGAIAGLRVRLGDRPECSFTAREYVLANGTLEISRLLLRAAKSSRHCPFADNSNIGRWFMDHLHGLCGEIVDADVARLGDLFDNLYVGGLKYNVKLCRDTGGLANVAATLNSRMSLGDLRRDITALGRRLFGRGDPSSLWQGAKLLPTIVSMAWRYVVRRRAASFFASGISLGIELEQLPNAESYLFLDPAVDPADARIGVHWALEGSEIHAVETIASQVGQWLKREKLGRLRVDPRVAARDPALLDGFHDAYHHMGGARMADTADDGVVDGECRVFGAPNLTIGGAAVFPSGSFANPTLSAIALGVRAADRIAQSLARRGLVPRLVFGCARLTGGASSREAQELLNTVFAAGVAAVDVAPNYGLGTAERVVGKAVKTLPYVRVIAKLGTVRPRHALALTWLRAAKRYLRGPSHRLLADFAPAEPCERFHRGLFGPQDLNRSLDAALRNLGRIDDLLLHDCAPGEFGADQQRVLGELAERTRARPGYALSSYFDLATDRRFPEDYVAECAVAPPMLSGPFRISGGKEVILHSIGLTSEWLASKDERYARGLAQAAALIRGVDVQTARIAAAYALVAAHVPQAKLVFTSSDRKRLAALLTAFAIIDEQDLVPQIAHCLSDDGEDKKASDCSGGG